MAEIHSQGLQTGGSWNSAPLRAAGLYGELQPLPLPVAATVSSATTRKTRLEPDVTD